MLRLEMHTGYLSKNTLLQVRLLHEPCKNAFLPQKTVKKPSPRVPSPLHLNYHVSSYKQTIVFCFAICQAPFAENLVLRMTLKLFGAASSRRKLRKTFSHTDREAVQQTVNTCMLSISWQYANSRVLENNTDASE